MWTRRGNPPSPYLVGQRCNLSNRPDSLQMPRHIQEGWGRRHPLHSSDSRKGVISFSRRRQVVRRSKGGQLLMILSQRQLEEIAASTTKDFNRFFFGDEADKPDRSALPTPIDQFAKNYLGLRVSFARLAGWKHLRCHCLCRH